MWDFKKWDDPGASDKTGSSLKTVAIIYLYMMLHFRAVDFKLLQVSLAGER